MSDRNQIPQYLENLRAKPEYVRRRIAFASSATIFALIFTVWIYARQPFSSDTSLPLSEAVKPMSVVANAFSGLKDNTTEMVSSIQQTIIDTQEATDTNQVESSYDENSLDINMDEEQSSTSTTILDLEQPPPDVTSFDTESNSLQPSL